VAKLLGLRAARRLWPALLVVAIATAAVVFANRWQSEVAPGGGPRNGLGPESGPQTRHPRLVNVATIVGAEAEKIYRAVLDELKAVYARSDDPVARAYASWRRYNRYPYRSARHGDLLVNNYANDAARSYWRFEYAGPMPAGALIAKDSFSVSRDGYVLVGPLFVMEKMPAGSNAGTGDWRYSLIDAHGERVGMTGGKDAERVRFCDNCHAKAPGGDRLYFMPNEVRMPFEPP
jgi:hypothetical protein